jgi:glycosyl transferase family 2/lipopolysaccharide kinase (Kdo/WaaP) family protein
VKRYHVFAPRLALASLGRDSPAVRAWTAAGMLSARGFRVPELAAAVEYRRGGLLRRSFFVTHEVPDALTADAYWHRILAEPDGPRRCAARRAFAVMLGGLFRRLHAAGVYHRDLKDANLLVTGPLSAPSCVLLDLEEVRVVEDVSPRRRVKNLVQLARTLGRHATASDHARFLAAYLEGATRGERRLVAEAVRRAAARKDRGRWAPPATPGPRLSCTVVCQNEEATLGACLESVTWCDELVVVDGGSTDGTRRRALQFTDRVLEHPWPGYRAQKQFALDAASGEWVLNVDADERVTPELAAEIRRVLRFHRPDVGGFAIPRLVCYLGRWWYRGGWYPRRIVRLMRRSVARWGGTDPHERAEVRGRVVPLRWPLLHYTYDDIADHLRTVNKLTDVAARQPRTVRRIGFGRLVAEPAWRFVRGYVLQRGFLDGIPGLFVAATAAFYTFLRWAKVRELGGEAAPLDAPGPRP